MSAIALCNADDSVIIASDGICMNPSTGQVLGCVEKIFPIPHLNCVFSHLGAGGVGHEISTAIGYRYRDFDDLLAEFELLFSAVAGGRGAVVVLAGWSGARQRFESYLIRSEAGENLVSVPWVLTPCESEFWMSQSPSPETAERLGIVLTSEEVARDPVGLAARLICAARADSGRQEDGRYGGSGGFLQIAMVRREGVLTWIAHRWPDTLGQRIDPTRGQMLPEFPLQHPWGVATLEEASADEISGGND